MTLTANLPRITSIYRGCKSIRMFLVEKHPNHLFIASHSAQPPLSLPFVPHPYLEKAKHVSENVDSIWHESSLPPKADSATPEFSIGSISADAKDRVLARVSFAPGTSRRDFNALRYAPTQILSTSPCIESFFSPRAFPSRAHRKNFYI